MAIYNIKLYNDMGHLIITPDYTQLPIHIYNFVRLKAKMYLDTATDKEGHGCLFFFLKPCVKDKWSYQCGSDIVNIEYQFTEFNPAYMKKTEKTHL